MASARELDVPARLAHLPTAEPLFVETNGRPGDWREPLGLGLARSAALASAAARARLDEGMALTLLVERELVLADVLGLGHDPADARALLNREAVGAMSALLGPGQPNAGYARALSGHGFPGPRRLDGVFSLPARLLERADRELMESILTERQLDHELQEAVRWEQGALDAGRLMGEWALLVLLAALPAGSLSQSD